MFSWDGTANSNASQSKNQLEQMRLVPWLLRKIKSSSNGDERFGEYSPLPGEHLARRKLLSFQQYFDWISPPRPVNKDVTHMGQNPRLDKKRFLNWGDFKLGCLVTVMFGRKLDK